MWQKQSIRYRHCTMKSSYVNFMYLSGETKIIKQLHCITHLVIVFSSKKKYDCTSQFYSALYRADT